MELNNENSNNFQRFLFYGFVWGFLIGCYNMIIYNQKKYETNIAKSLLYFVSSLVWIISISIVIFQGFNTMFDLEEESNELKIPKYIIFGFLFIIQVLLFVFLLCIILAFIILIIGRFHFDAFLNYFLIEDIFYLFNYFKKKKILKKYSYERFIEKNNDAIKLNQPILATNEFLDVDLNSSFFKRASVFKFISLTKVWKLAENEVLKNEEKLNKYISIYGRENVIAAFAYTCEEQPIYKNLNKSLRDLQTTLGKTFKAKNEINLWSILPVLKSFVYSFSFLPLIAHLNDLQLKSEALPENVFYYRGCSVPFVAQIDDLVCICDYTSTSTNYEVAKKFTQNCGTLLKFTGMVSGISLQEMSFFPNENEVLLFPLQVFRVTKIVQNENTTEITLFSITRLMIQLYEKLDKLFLFQLNIQNNCSFLLEKILLPKLYFLFKNSHLRQYGYVKQMEFYGNTEQLPPCHILTISKRLNSNKPIFKKFLLVPNIQTLIDCFEKKEKLYIKECLVKYELDYENSTNFDICTVIIKEFNNEFPNLTVQNIIKFCQENDSTGSATSFVIGKGIEIQVWENFFKNGFSKHLHDKIKICIVDESLNENIKNNFLTTLTDSAVENIFTIFKKLSDLWF